MAIITTSQAMNKAILITMTKYTTGRSGRVGVAIDLCKAVIGAVNQSRSSAFDCAPGLNVDGAAEV